jgi:hypothetical protein
MKVKSKVGQVGQSGSDPLFGQKTACTIKIQAVEPDFKSGSSGTEKGIHLKKFSLKVSAVDIR